jgi:hypothetical protein
MSESWRLVICYLAIRAERVEGRQIQAGCTCLENRIGIAEVGALPTPSAILRSEPMRAESERRRAFPVAAQSHEWQANFTLNSQQSTINQP